jgi:hypothetical protein
VGAATTGRSAGSSSSGRPTTRAVVGGFAPTLFDAPSRDSRAPIVWTAHSFLAFIAEEGMQMEARAVLGFSWGFSIDNATFAYEAPAALAPSVWGGHRAFLAQEHPSWRFANGYRND